MDLLSRVDHLIYASPELDRGINEIESLLGVRATPGGQHPGRGTRNALVALGPTNYLEILAPDPEQPAPKEPLLFGLDKLESSRLVVWFLKASELKSVRDEAVRQGVPYGEVMTGSRRRTDGTELSWVFTDPSAPVCNGIVPLLIDWGQSTHPAGAASKGASLVGLSAEHPDPERVRKMLQALGVDMEVETNDTSSLVATIKCPRGSVELR